jgi:hypothetical protein
MNIYLQFDHLTGNFANSLWVGVRVRVRVRTRIRVRTKRSGLIRTCGRDKQPDKKTKRAKAIGNATKKTKP